MLNFISKTNLPLSLGTGSSTIDEIRSSINFLYKKKKKLR